MRFATVSAAFYVGVDLHARTKKYRVSYFLHREIPALQVDRGRFAFGAGALPGDC